MTPVNTQETQASEDAIAPCPEISGDTELAADLDQPLIDMSSVRRALERIDDLRDHYAVFSTLVKGDFFLALRIAQQADRSDEKVHNMRMYELLKRDAELTARVLPFEVECLLDNEDVFSSLIAHGIMYNNYWNVVSLIRLGLSRENAVVSEEQVHDNFLREIDRYIADYPQVGIRFLRALKAFHQRGQECAVGGDLADEYRGEALRHFESKVVDNYGTALTLIADQHPRKVGTIYKAVAEAFTPEELPLAADLILRYLEHAVDIMELLESETAVLESTLRNDLETLAAASRKSRYNIFDALTKEFFLDRHADLADFVTRYPQSGPALVDRFGTNVFEMEEKHPGVFKAVRDAQWAGRDIVPRLTPKVLEQEEYIVGLAGLFPEQCATVFRSAPLTMLETRLPQLLQLSARYKEGVIGFVEAFGEDFAEVEQTHQDFFKDVQSKLFEHDVPDDLPRTIAVLSLDFLEEYKDELLEIANTAGQYTLAAFAGLSWYYKNNPEDFRKRFPLLRDIAIASSFNAEAALRELPQDFLDEHGEYFLQLAKEIPTFFPRVCKYLPRELLATEPDLVKYLVADYGENVWGLFSRYGEASAVAAFEYRNLHQNLKLTCREGLGEAIAYVPDKVLEQSPELAQAFGPGLGLIYSEWEEKSLELLQLLQTTTTETGETLLQHVHDCGLYHLTRYVRHTQEGFDLSLLQQNARNLSPQQEDARPVLLYLSVESDHNGGVAQETLSLLKKLSLYYRLVFFGANSKKDIEVARDRAFDVSQGSGIAYTVIDAHACEHFVRVGEMTAQASRSVARGEESSEACIAKHDHEFHAGWSDVMAEGGSLVLGCCSVAKGGPAADNFVMANARANPSLHVIGPRRSASFEGFRYGDEGEIKSILYSCASHLVHHETPALSLAEDD